jgi:nucleoside-diphosphate-sugar epimerase
MDHHRVLVFGGSGGIGSILVAALKARGHEVCSPRTAEVDITNVHAVRNVIENWKPDILLHAAGVTHSHNTSAYYSVNVVGTRNIVECMRPNRNCRLVYLSSRAAEPGGGAYAESKRAAERAIIESGVKWTIVRPAEVYGGSASEAVSVLVNWVSRWHIAPVINRPQALLAPVYVDDVVDSVIRTIEASGLEGRIYTLAGPETLTHRELALRIAHALRTHVHIVPVPIWILRACSFVARLCRSKVLVSDQIDRLLVPKLSDSSSAIRDLNFRQTKLEEGLAKLVVSI